MFATEMGCFDKLEIAFDHSECVLLEIGRFYSFLPSSTGRCRHLNARKLPAVNLILYFNKFSGRTYRSGDFVEADTGTHFQHTIHRLIAAFFIKSAKIIPRKNNNRKYNFSRNSLAEHVGPTKRCIRWLLHEF